MRATAFRLTLVYLLIFIIFAVSLLGYFALNTRRLITDQITNRVNLEVNALREQYETGGIRRLVDYSRFAGAASGFKPLSADHAERRGAGRQCQLVRAGRPRSSGMV